MLHGLERVELKMSRGLRCSSVTYRFGTLPPTAGAARDRLAGGSSLSSTPLNRPQTQCTNARVDVINILFGRALK